MAICLQRVQLICIRSTWCHCHPIISYCIKMVTTYPGCPGKKPLNGCLDCLFNTTILKWWTYYNTYMATRQHTSKAISYTSHTKISILKLMLSVFWRPSSHCPFHDCKVPAQWRVILDTFTVRFSLEYFYFRRNNPTKNERDWSYYGHSEWRNKITTRMLANAQRDGRLAEYRWRPLFNAAKFG